MPLRPLPNYTASIEECRVWLDEAKLAGVDWPFHGEITDEEMAFRIIDGRINGNHQLGCHVPCPNCGSNNTQLIRFANWGCLSCGVWYTLEDTELLIEPKPTPMEEWTFPYVGEPSDYEVRLRAKEENHQLGYRLPCPGCGDNNTQWLRDDYWMCLDCEVWFTIDMAQELEPGG